MKPLLLSGALILAGLSPAQAQVIDPQLRSLILETQNLDTACFSGALPEADAMAPITGLGGTDEYGSDQATQDFAWGVMVLGARALGGDSGSSAELADIFNEWADSGALMSTERSHDAVYALKRTLLPMIVSYSIARPIIPEDRRIVVETWLDRLVALASTEFDGDVDFNNHRYLADSVIAAWGALSDDPSLLDTAEARLVYALTEQLREDGSWPLETRRGARALWYTRQSLASLTFIINMLEAQGRDPMADPTLQAQYEKALTYLLDGIRNPAIVTKYAVENYIPGPSADYTQQDLSFLETRPHGRHYMAFLASARFLVSDPDLLERIDRFLREVPEDQYPMIDEFSGGNTTCIWGFVE